MTPSQRAIRRGKDTLALLRRRANAANDYTVACSARELESIELVEKLPPPITTRAPVPGSCDFRCERLVADERRDDLEIEVVVYFSRGARIRFDGDHLHSWITLTPEGAQGAPIHIL